MRLAGARGRTLFFAAALIVSLLALLPLRLGIAWLGFDRHGLTAREATGSIWLGALQEARFGAVPIGDVGARLHALPLLIGRGRLSLRSSDGDSPFAAAATVTRHSFGLDDVDGLLPVGTLFAPLPVTALELDGLTVRFASGLCTEAQGHVRARLAGTIAGLPLPDSLAGTARCDGGALLIPLAGRSGAERVEARLAADGRYRLDLLVRPTDAAAAERLAAAGFVPARGGHALRLGGSL